MQEPKRPEFEEEKEKPWLTKVLNAYQGIDEYIYEQNKDKNVACKKGCKNCCCQTVHITSIEHMTIEWYVKNKSDKKEQIKENLKEKSPWCPFLVEDCCAIYPIRPLNCRQVLAYNKECNLFEGIGGILLTRPHEIFWGFSSSEIKNASFNLFPNEIYFDKTPSFNKYMRELRSLSWSV